MLTNDSLGSADGRAEATTRRGLLQMAATVAATVPLAALTAVGTAQPAPVTPASASRRIRRAVLVPDSAVTPPLGASRGFGALIIGTQPAARPRQTSESTRGASSWL
jgi:hypothetical protein